MVSVKITALAECHVPKQNAGMHAKTAQYRAFYPQTEGTIVIKLIVKETIKNHDKITVN